VTLKIAFMTTRSEKPLPNALPLRDESHRNQKKNHKPLLYVNKMNPLKNSKSCLNGVESYTRHNIKGRTFYDYELRTNFGAFTCTAPSLIACRSRCNVWLERQQALSAIRPMQPKVKEALARAYEPWTGSEDEYLLKLTAKLVVDAASIYTRSPNAIIQRLKRLLDNQNLMSKIKELT